MASYPHIMVGKLILNPRYLIFHIYEPRDAGILQYGRLTSTGRVLSIPLTTILDATVESGVRARRSRPNWKNKDDFEKKTSGERAINTHPGFLDDSESYSRLMLCCRPFSRSGSGPGGSTARTSRTPQRWQSQRRPWLQRGTTQPWNRSWDASTSSRTSPQPPGRSSEPSRRRNKLRVSTWETQAGSVEDGSA